MNRLSKKQNRSSISNSNNGDTEVPSSAQLLIIPREDREGPPYDQLSAYEKFRLYNQAKLTADEQSRYLDEVAVQRAVTKRFMDDGSLDKLTIADVDSSEWPSDGVFTLVGLSKEEQARYFIYKFFNKGGALLYVNALRNGQYNDLIDYYQKKAWDEIPINTQDQMKKDGLLTPLQLKLWQDAWNEAGAKALAEINAKQYVTNAEFDAINNGPGWSTIPNSTDVSDVSWDNLTGRTFWDTRRFTFQQALLYLNNSTDEKLHPKPGPDPCDKILEKIDWLSPSTIAPNLAEYVQCKAIAAIKPYMTTIEIILFLLITGIGVAGIGLYRSGVLGYAKQVAIGVSGVGPIVGAGQYIRNKKRIAKKNGTSIQQEAAKDLAIGAANPLALVGKVAGEEMEN